ncbi:MAG: sensor histidine kinase [Panacagrimonas sp.]
MASDTEDLLRRELEHQIAERGRIEIELHEKTEQLARSHAELEQLTYVVSHDLRAPLRTVAGFAQLLSKRYGGVLQGDGQEFLSFIDSGVRKMQRLIDDLLLYSRAARAPVTPGWIDGEVLVQQIRTSLHAALERSGAQLETGHLPRFWGDAAPLLQVCLNLIDNAIKFQPRGQTAAVSLDCEESSEGWTFRVGDNGIGIASESHERVFVLFQRLHHEDEYDGTGLGLSICKKIVERHGGRIWLESEPGQGSRFKFFLPRAVP